MLTRLAINLFALLNVILFYCWIKRTGNLMFLRLVHVTSPEDVSHVSERERLYPEHECQIPHTHPPKKRIKYDVIKRQCYELTDLGNHYIKIVNSRIIKLNLFFFFYLVTHACRSIRSTSGYRLSRLPGPKRREPYLPTGKGAANFIIALLFRSLDFIELVELAS